MVNGQNGDFLENSRIRGEMKWQNTMAAMVEHNGELNQMISTNFCMVQYSRLQHYRAGYRETFPDYGIWIPNMVSSFSFIQSSKP